VKQEMLARTTHPDNSKKLCEESAGSCMGYWKIHQSAASCMGYWKIHQDLYYEFIAQEDNIASAHLALNARTR
jgi:hypothetical protein